MSTAELDEQIAARLDAVRSRIAAAQARSSRSAPEVALLAVTKGFGDEVIAAALANGLVELGESYAQELVGKAQRAADAGLAPRWHMVGRLQRNKVKTLAPHVVLWHSVDRASVGAEIARRAPGAAVLVQANLSGEPHKGGCATGEVPQLVEELRALGLDVRGLMGVGPAGDPERSRDGFATLVDLADRLELEVRCIGMSTDLEVAVEEGSTMVRIGTALFGPRDATSAASNP
jgi:PLP dependent protein